MSKRTREDDDIIEYDPLEPTRIIQIPNEQQQQQQPSARFFNKPIICTLPPICSSTPHLFQSQDSFELHYLSQHTHICDACDGGEKNFPDQRLLSLHLTEYHDPFVAMKMEKNASLASRRKTNGVNNTDNTDDNDNNDDIDGERLESVYGCFAHGCDEAFSFEDGRVKHLVEYHAYPSDFDFCVVRDGIESGQNSLVSRYKGRIL